LNNTLKVYNFDVKRSSAPGTEVFDITEDVRGGLKDSRISEGMLHLFVSGSTAGVTTIEFESGAVHDFKNLFEKVAPSDKEYMHNERWHDGNGYSHVRASLLGPGLSVPITEGKLMLGTWQQIVLCDFDNKPRQRTVHCKIMGIGENNNG
jgi:secondary thiamine-phosphate synthase enzyme